MDEIFVYYASLPDGINEWVTPCAEGYTIYLDESCLCNDGKRMRLYNHAIRHIRGRDFEKGDVSDAEKRSRREL